MKRKKLSTNLTLGTKFFLTISIIAILFIYSKLLINRIQERAYTEAISSYYTQKILLVGSSGYGQVNNLRVAVGSEVNQGDVLFSFVKNDFSVQQDNIVRAGAPGKVKKINVLVGSYVTPDLTIMEIQSREISIKSKLKISGEDASRLVIGSPTFTLAPDGSLYGGNITSIYPIYNNSEQTVDIESNISSIPNNLLEGTPVKTKVFLGDDIANSLRSTIDKITLSRIRDFYIYNP